MINNIFATKKKSWFFPGGKQPGHRVKHPIPFNAEVKNKCSYASAPPICLHGTNRKNFTIT
jgi:hypothetical protein